MSTSPPVLIPEPFANDAGPSFINAIPATTADPQRAAYDEGFPAATFQPEASGGLPPLGQDFNGILNAITQHLFSLQGGALQTYRADVAAAIGGYNVGALVAMLDGQGYWINLVDDNATDPDAGGAGWQPVYAYGSAPIAVTGGARTLTAIEASRPFIVLTGTLSGNQQIIFPNAFRHWLVINLCVMGGFTVTAKTVAGVGVDVPAGGAASPLAIYSDSVDVFRVFTPSALPTSVSPTPDSIALRDNLGNLFTTTGVLGNATTLVASTAFVNPGSSLLTNGYRMNPDGSIEQWGFKSRAGSAVETVFFPLEFPHECFNVQLTIQRTGSDSGQAATVGATPGTASFTLFQADSSTGVFWRAIGR